MLNFCAALFEALGQKRNHRISIQGDGFIPLATRPRQLRSLRLRAVDGHVPKAL
jgi:hypothetical protein